MAVERLRVEGFLGLLVLVLGGSTGGGVGGDVVVEDGSTQKVAVDAVGCIPGDWVICVGSSAAREAAGSKSYPSDLTIVGIIDHWEPEPPKPAAPAVVN